MSSTYTFGNINYSYTPPAAGITTSTASVSGTSDNTSSQSYTILSNFVISGVTYTVNNIANNAFTSVSLNAVNYTSIILPNTITRIGFAAFAKAFRLTSIVLPSSLTRIEGDNSGTSNGAFFQCTALTTITINSTGTLVIGNNAFKDIGLNRGTFTINLILNSIPPFINSNIDTMFDANSLVSFINITINALGNISDNSFLNLTKINNVTFNNITNIGTNAFKGCTGLTNLIIPTNITAIGASSFEGCTGLSNITLNSSLVIASLSSFSNCTSLTTITLNSFPLLLPFIYDSINNSNINIIFNYTGIIPNKGFFKSFTLKNLTIPSSITAIGISAFNNCIYLTNISIPNTVTSIGDYAFANCTSLNNLTIPPSVTTFYKNNYIGLPKPYNVIISNSSNINLLDQSSNIIWYNTNIKRTSDNSVIFNGYFSIDSSNGFINVFYDSTNLTQNIIAVSDVGIISIFTYDNKADFFFNIESNTFTISGTTINSIPALDAQYNASKWSITNSSNVLFYKDSTTGDWNNIPVGTVSITNTRLYTNPIPSFDFPTISPICFPAGTPVLTDQGIFAIETIDINCNTINGNKIKAITKTFSLEPELVLIKQNAININVPDKDTITTMNHEILYNNIMTKAKDLVGFVEGVSTVKNTNEYLYNVLLNKHSIMIVNNMIVETLHPDNVIATIYNNSTNEDERNKLKLLLNNAILTKDFNKYDEFFKLLKIC